MREWNAERLGDVCRPRQWKTVSSEKLLRDGYPVYGANGIIGCYTEFTHEKETLLVTCRGATCGTLNICKPYSYVNGNAMALDDLSKDIYLKYLYYYLGFRGFDDVVSGSAQPQIIRTTIQKIEIRYPSLAAQQKIAAELDKISDLISKRKSQMEKLDLLVKAKFVEMFGDETQFHRWTCSNIGEVADIYVGVVIKPAQYYTNKENGVRAFRSLNVGEMHIKDSNWVYFTSDGHMKNSKSKLLPGDVLIVRSGAPGTACVVTTDYAGCNAIDIIIARPHCMKVHPLYLCAFTNYPHGKTQIQEGTGGAAQQHFNVGRYREMLISLPPLPLQTQFADFVQKTEQTKAAMQKSLTGLETLYKARMQEYFE